MKLLIFVSFLRLILGKNVNIEVETTNVIGTLPDDSFLSVTLDASVSHSADWDGLNFILMELFARGLGPSYIRFGGNYADESIFVDHTRSNLGFRNVTGNTITPENIDQLWSFANRSDWRLIFDLNQCLRAGSFWNSSNAKSFLDYVSSRGYDMDFELGNEPDQYWEKFNVNLTGTQIAEGYKDLRKILNYYDLYKHSFLMGPSVAGVGDSKKLFEDFLVDGGGDMIEALTFHHYYFNGNDSTQDDYLSLKTLDSFKPNIDVMKTFNYTPIWLSETGTDWCSCAKNRTNTFLDGFVWLDKLGLCATNGVARVIRQDIWGAPFGLLDHDMNPRPDYWLSVLHKKLVGSTVYGVTTTPSDSKLRVYAGSFDQVTNGVIIYGINVGNESFTADFSTTTTVDWDHNATVYMLESSEDGVLESESKLNGQVLTWKPHKPIINMKPRIVNFPMEIPPFSQFFVTLNLNPTPCNPAQGWYSDNSVTNKCVKFLTNYHSPFFSANFYCQTFGYGTSLLSIGNAFENAAIKALMPNVTNGCPQYFLGLYNEGNNWLWSNGNSGTYRNWARGYPIDDPTKNCVVFDVETGTWMNADCDSSFCYVCQQIS